MEMAVFVALERVEDKGRGEAVADPGLDHDLGPQVPHHAVKVHGLVDVDYAGAAFLLALSRLPDHQVIEFRRPGRYLGQKGLVLELAEETRNFLGRLRLLCLLCGHRGPPTMCILPGNPGSLWLSGG